MIPYEELVVALQAWRAKQGLPISQMSGQLAMPPAAAAPAPAPTRGAPPAPPKAPPGRAPSPPPAVQAGHDEVDVDSAMLEEAYEPAPGDFAMQFDNNADGDDATAIGGPPTDPSGRGGGRKPGW